MLRNLLSNRLFIGILVLLICGVVSVYFLRTDLPEEPIKIYKPVEPLPKPKAEAPIGETEQDGHVHEDGTWHEGPHEEADDTLVQPTQPPAPRGTPFANFSPDPNDDPVAAAHKRLDYIANNLHEWGQFSPKTLELIDDLTPMPEPPKVEGDGDHTVDLLKELSALRDPRSAEILIKYQMESGIMGRPVDEALVAIGPASVPALIARLDDFSSDSALSIPLELLVPIVAEHRTTLGGIVEHIIIPKLEAIAASTNTYRYYAEQTIAELQQ